MLSSPIVPADSIPPAHFFLDFLNTPVVLSTIRLALAALALGLLGMYLYTRKKSRKEARASEDPPRS